MSMKNDKMATMSIKKLMLTTGIPVMFSLALQALYNIVDSAFVSNMATNGEEGLNALTLVFPVQMFIVALSVGTGVGAMVMISRFLGLQQPDKAKIVTSNAIFLGFILSAVVIMFGFFLGEMYISSQTNNEIIYEMAVDYLKINCYLSVGCVFFGIFEKLLQSTGRSLYSTIAQICGAVVNIVLDPILIYGWFGFEAMGVVGAAYATVIGQIVGFLMAFMFHLRLNKHINGGIKSFKLDGEVIKKIYIIGFPAIIAQGLISIMTYFLNVIFVMASESIVTVYGLYYKIQQFIIMMVFGLRDAAMPIISFSYATNKQRLKQSIKYVFIYALGLMVVGTIAFEVFANIIASAFGLSGETMSLCISAIRLISLSFLFAGFNISTQAVFQSIGSGVKSLVISFARQIVFVLPVAFLFTQLAISNADLTWTVWLTFIIAETITAIIATIMLVVDYKNKVQTLSFDTVSENL